MTFKKGDRVYVTDRGLAQIREIMRRATGKDVPNHHGTVLEVWDQDRMLLIAFDEDGVEGAGNSAPYPPDEVRSLRHYDVPDASPKLRYDLGNS